MLYQITSATGPIECAIAVTKLFKSLAKEYQSIEIIHFYDHPIAQMHYNIKDACSSIFFTCDEEISDICGTIKWICESPVRPNHKRKNWFIKVAKIPELNEIDTSFSDKDLKFESCKSSGPGGQHVNKTESGIILTHISTGIKITSFAERSQHMNRKIAIDKLRIELNRISHEQLDKQNNDAWKEQCSVERGNEVRVYKGMSFKRIK